MCGVLANASIIHDKLSRHRCEDEAHLERRKFAGLSLDKRLVRSVRQRVALLGLHRRRMAGGCGGRRRERRRAAVELALAQLPHRRRQPLSAPRSTPTKKIATFSRVDDLTYYYYSSS